MAGYYLVLINHRISISCPIAFVLRSFHLVKISKTIISNNATLYGALAIRHYAYESFKGIISFIPVNKFRRSTFNNKETKTQKINLAMCVIHSVVSNSLQPHRS